MGSVPQLPSYEQATAAGGLLQQSRRSVHSSSEVEHFMKTKDSGLDGSIHPSLNTQVTAIKFDAEKALWVTVGNNVNTGDVSQDLESKSKLDPRRHKWSQDELPNDLCFKTLFKDVQKDEDNFRNAVATFEREAEPKYKVGIDLSKAHSIDDVLQTVRAAQEAYNDKSMKGIFAPIRKAFRKIGTQKETYARYLQLAPAQSAYFSLVCGGVMLLLEAAGRLQEINNDIIEALADVPVLVEKSQRLLAAYPKSLNMQTSCTVIYKEVLLVLGNILQFYRERCAPKALKAFAKQSMFQRDLSDRLVLLKRYANEIEEERKVCSAETCMDTNRTTRSTNCVAEAIYEKQGMTHEEVTEMHGEVVELRLQVQALNCIFRQFQAKPAAYVLSKSETVTSDRESPPAESPSKDIPSRGGNKDLRKQLMKHFGYQRRVTRNNRQSNMSQIMSFTRDDQNRTVYVMQSPTLQSWLKETHSSALLINGNMPGSSTLRTPISFVSAKLADALRHSHKRSSVINLHFFCGEHESWREHPDNGPTAVWKSLISQLLLQYDHLSFTDLRKLSKVDADDLNALAQAFSSLLKELPLGFMVFCIVDSVSLYDDERRNEVESLVEVLVDLVRASTATRCIFKVLLTAATQLRLDAVEYLDEEVEILQVPEAVERGDGFSDMKWETSVGQEIKNM